jgi:nicotinate phosphoribosyltransferase
VKLSDNPNKVLGPTDEVERYQRIFGLAGMKAASVIV